MKILAVDTSSKRCSVSILDNEEILINLINDDEKTHSVKLMPLIDEAFKKTKLCLNDMSLFACAIGPGSFTGIRIGIATIKAFADVTNIPALGITSLESLAYNVQTLEHIQVDSSSIICSLIDAKNENVYCGVYNFSDNYCNLISIFSDTIQHTIEKIKKLESQFTNIIFVGDGSILYKDLLQNNFKNCKFANYNLQSGVSLAKAAFAKYKLGEYGNSSVLSPIYLKKSQAERTLEEKINIKEMSSEDIRIIEPDFNIKYDKFWNIQNLKNDFENTNSYYYIATLDNEIVGFAGILKILDEANIMNIVTKIDKRNLGIGSKLLEMLIKKSSELKCKSITLEVNAKNLHAIHLYEKFAFKRIGLRKKYYNNTDDAILMRYDLN